MPVETRIIRTAEAVTHHIIHAPRPVKAIGLITLALVLTFRDGKIHPLDIPDSAYIDTDCRGSMEMGQIREELRNPRVNYRGFLEGSRAIAAFNNAACNIPDMRNPALAGNEYWLCGRRFTVGGIARELFDQRYPGPWDSGEATAAYKRAAFPDRCDGAVV